MKKTIRNYLLTALTVLLLLAPGVVHLIKIENSWHLKDVGFKQISIDSSRNLLVNLEVDTSVPAVGDSPLVFSAPFGLNFSDTAYNSCSFSYGDTLECDFVSWSHDFFRHRMVKLFVNGKEYDAKLTTRQLTRLYISALRQNGLEQLFKEESGKRLTYFSAKQAIRRLDKTLFEEGIHRAYDYPYDRRRVKIMMALSTLLLIPICMIGAACFSLAYETAAYRIWLKGYNSEKKESWDKIAGKLPQFVSLKESGLHKPVPEHRKIQFRERLKHLYR